MDSRIEGSLTEKDRLAVETALEKAIATGARIGMIEAAAQIEEAHPEVQVETKAEINSTDDWAARYGS